MLGLNADPAQVPRGPLIVPWMFEDGRLERGFVAVAARAGINKGVVQVGSPLRGGHQAWLNEREPVKEAGDVGPAA